MTQKRILLVSRSFFPVNSPRSFRCTELAKEFSRQGHSVTVITPMDPLQEEIARQYKFELKDLEGYDPIKFQPKKAAGLLARVKGRFREQFLLFPEILIKDYVFSSLKKEEGKNYDLLISIAAPHPVHWGVAKALRKYNGITRTWVADCGDPFMLSHNMQFKYPFYFKFFEKDFCRRADFISIPTEAARDGYYNEFQKKLTVIPQGFKFEDVKLSENRSPQGIVSFGYAGSLVKGRRDPSELLAYLQDAGIDFRFSIYSKNQAFAKELERKFKGSVNYKGEADRLQLLQELSEMDFVINFENLGSNQTPSKLIDYAIIKKPILSIRYGSLNARIVDEFISGNYSSGWKVENVDQYRIETIIEKFLALSERTN